MLLWMWWIILCKSCAGWRATGISCTIFKKKLDVWWMWDCFCFESLMIWVCLLWCCERWVVGWRVWCISAWRRRRARANFSRGSTKLRERRARIILLEVWVWVRSMLDWWFSVWWKCWGRLRGDVCLVGWWLWRDTRRRETSTRRCALRRMRARSGLFFKLFMMLIWWLSLWMIMVWSVRGGGFNLSVLCLCLFCVGVKKWWNLLSGLGVSFRKSSKSKFLALIIWCKSLWKFLLLCVSVLLLKWNNLKFFLVFLWSWWVFLKMKKKSFAICFVLCKSLCSTRTAFNGLCVMLLMFYCLNVWVKMIKLSVLLLLLLFFLLVLLCVLNLYNYVMRVFVSRLFSRRIRCRDGIFLILCFCWCWLCFYFVVWVYGCFYLCCFDVWGFEMCE